MPGYYSLDELSGARVYDSIGLLYGLVGGFRVEPDDLYVEVVITAGSRERVVDVDGLKKALSKAGVRIGDEPLEVLVSMAREAGIDIPYQVASERVVMLKGLVPSREVAVADYRDDIEGGMGILLLSTPREARYRGVGGEPRRRLLPEASIKGKPVISKSRGLLGLAHSYVVGPGGLGLRVSSGEVVSSYVNWLGFLAHVKRVNSSLYNKLAERIDPYRRPKVPLAELEQLMDYIREGGFEEVLEGYTIRRPEKRHVVDVGWSSVVSVGDAIIVE